MVDVTVDTYANIPAAGNAGDLFFPTDGYHAFRDDGANWQAWGDVYPLTEPPTSGWSWVNQDTATITSTRGGLLMQGGTPTAGTSLNCYVRSAPSPPYTVDALILWGHDSMPKAQYGETGMVWRDSGAGLLTVWRRYQWSASVVAACEAAKFNSPVSYNSSISGTQCWVPLDGYYDYIFYRLEDDNTNRYWYYSMDGVHYVSQGAVARTSFHTPDQIGFYTWSHTLNVNAWLLHWKES